MNIIKVQFHYSKMVYIYKTDKNLKKNDLVVCQTEFDVQLGKCISDSKKSNSKEISSITKEIIREATPKDIKDFDSNLLQYEGIIKECKRLVLKEQLEMFINDCFYSLDKKMLVIRFSSNERIDFRNLVKSLAFKYKTRLELRQIGVRDRSAIIGGLGPCGRLLCCNNYLYSFESISINMAKNQNISLNPDKINGICGRLLCCLKYEDHLYTDFRKTLPKLNSIISIEGKSGKVISLNIYKKEYTVLFDDRSQITFKGK